MPAFFRMVVIVPLSRQPTDGSTGAGKFSQLRQNSRNPVKKIPVPSRREFCCKLLNLRVNYGADSQN
jgi:hypothetical protein